MIRFFEVAAVANRNVDADAGIIRHVKLLGETSSNGRSYPPATQRLAAPKYVGKKVYLNHPRRDNTGEDRPFQDWVGVIESAEYRDGGIYGTIKLRKESPHFKQIIEAAREFSNSFGMSHVADGASEIRDGIEVVTEIREILSVDIVTDPATVTSLFESSDGGSDQAALPLIRKVLAAIEVSLSGDDTQGGDASTLLDQLIQSLAADPTSGGNAMRAAKLAAATINHALSTPDNVAAMAAAKSALRVLKQVSGVAPAPAPTDEIELPPCDPRPAESPFEAAESARYRQRWESRTGGSYEDRFARASERARAAIRRRKG